jgi:hypothetical protein
MSISTLLDVRRQSARERVPTAQYYASQPSRMPAEPEPPYSQTRHFSGRFSLLGKVSAESSIVVTTDFHSPTIL